MAIPAVASAVHGRTSSVKFVRPKPGATTKSKVTFTVELENFEIEGEAHAGRDAREQRLLSGRPEGVDYLHGHLKKGIVVVR